MEAVESPEPTVEDVVRLFLDAKEDVRFIVGDADCRCVVCRALEVIVQILSDPWWGHPLRIAYDGDPFGRSLD